VAAPRAVITRGQLQRELEALRAMLPIWREKLRDEAQFGPQFHALAAEILGRTAPADRDFAREAIDRMLAEAGAPADASPAAAHAGRGVRREA